MKNLLTILFVVLSLSAMSQTASIKKTGHATLSGSTSITPKTVTKGIYIQPDLQKDLKDLLDQMKPYEDAYKEYSRLAGLRIKIYETLIKSTEYKSDSLASQPKITQDSIIMVFKK